MSSAKPKHNSVVNDDNAIMKSLLNSEPRYTVGSLVT